MVPATRSLLTRFRANLHNVHSRHSILDFHHSLLLTGSGRTLFKTAEPGPAITGHLYTRRRRAVHIIPGTTFVNALYYRAGKN